VANKKEEEKKRGPKGGIKHKPGRGHDRKSHRRLKKRFEKKAKKRREEAKAENKQAWETWDSLPLYVQDKRPDLRPKLPRPTNEN
jgi:hypothetical protein